MHYNLTAQQVAAVVAMLPDDGDEQLRLDCLEGETDLHEFASRLLAHNEDDEGIVNALAEQIDDRKVRQDRAKTRIQHRRDMLKALMDMAGIDKLALPEATISKRDVAPKVIVVDEALLPDSLCKFSRKPDMAAIKALETLLPGLSMDNGGTSITVRRK